MQNVKLNLIDPPINMCQSKHWLFTAKRHVLIRRKNNMKQPMELHIANISEQFFFKLFCSLYQLLASNTIFATCKIKLHFFPILLIFPIYITSLYFTMGKGKFSPIFTPSTLESMIEYTLISSIFERIREMTTKPWECQRDDN